jgi:uncharacterized protein
MVEFAGYDEGTPCWVDLSTPNLEGAKRFYTDLFGWDYVDTGEAGGGYQLAHLNGKLVAGLGPKQVGDEGPSVWVTYLWADDADLVAAAIGKAGGTVFMGPMDVPGAGRMALALDSTSAAFGIWQGREHRGAQLANEPGAFSWNENLNSDPAQARDFYQQVFGYAYESLPNWPGDYSTFKVKGEVRGGIGGRPEGIPAEAPNFWNTYFSVADTDAAAATITANGGKVKVPPMDTPFGRMAAVADASGANFCIISAPSQ